LVCPHEKKTHRYKGNNYIPIKQKYKIACIVDLQTALKQAMFTCAEPMYTYPSDTDMIKEAGNQLLRVRYQPGTSTITGKKYNSGLSDDIFSSWSLVYSVSRRIRQDEMRQTLDSAVQGSSVVIMNCTPEMITRVQKFGFGENTMAGAMHG